LHFSEEEVSKLHVEPGPNPGYPVERNNQDSNVAERILTQFIPERTPAPPKPSVNSLPLKSKVPIMSWDPKPSSYLSFSSVQRFMIPRCPLRRLRPGHRAIKGTTDEYSGRLVGIFPELADIEHGEIEKTFRRMRGKEELEP